MTPEKLHSIISESTHTYDGIKKFFSIKGFSTPAIRKLVHLISKESHTYLETGTYCGATFCSSFHKTTTSIGIENFSQPFGEVNVKEQLQANINTFKHLSKKVILHNADFFSINLSTLPNNIDFFFYDGNHSEECQAKALPHIFPNLADTFVFMVDDFNWPDVFNGTNKSIQSVNHKINILASFPIRGYSLNDDPIWHNGIALFLISKL